MKKKKKKKEEEIKKQKIDEEKDSWESWKITIDEHNNDMNWRIQEYEIIDPDVAKAIYNIFNNSKGIKKL